MSAPLTELSKLLHNMASNTKKIKSEHDYSAIALYIFNIHSIAEQQLTEDQPLNLKLHKIKSKPKCHKYNGEKKKKRIAILKAAG